jgi:two-component system cell cycle sensor histidine kinase/response regulator CckA
VTGKDRGRTTGRVGKKSDALRVTNQRLKWLFDDAPLGILFLDLAGIVVDTNKAFLKALGVSRDAVVGKAFADRLAREDRDDVADQLSKVVMGTMRAARLENVRVPGPGERELSASLYVSRLEQDGEVSGLIVHVMDAAESRDLEVQFIQAQKMHAVGQLAGGIAHDFNNLLTAMLGFCDLLLTRHEPGDPSFDDIVQIRRNASRATNLVRQLLAFSRKQTLKPVVLDVGEALSDLSNMLGRLLGANIELRFEHDRDPGLVRVDPGQFDQVIINLAVNARDAMPGGGTLAIRTSHTVVEKPIHRGADVMAPGAYVLIEVSDTGVGIPKEVIGNIFEPFFSTKEVGAGTGLGLSTVHGIVHQTEGYIFVDSAPGQGTVFSIYLPSFAGDATTRDDLTSATVEAARRVASAGDFVGAGTVLLVEDEDAVRMFVARALRDKGYRVLEAVDGECALDVISGGDAAIDLIVSDIVMPGMDGQTLVRLVRQELTGVKVILMSGYAEDGLAGDHQGDPSIRFLPKPFTLAELAGSVKEVMEG